MRLPEEVINRHVDNIGLRRQLEFGEVVVPRAADSDPSSTNADTAVAGAASRRPTSSLIRPPWPQQARRDLSLESAVRLHPPSAHSRGRMVAWGQFVTEEASDSDRRTEEYACIADQIQRGSVTWSALIPLTWSSFELFGEPKMEPTRLSP